MDGASGTRNVPNVEVEAEAGEMERTHRARSRLDVLDVERVLKGVEAEAPAIEFEERESSFGEEYGPDIFHGHKAVDVLQGFVSSGV